MSLLYNNKFTRLIFRLLTAALAAALFLSASACTSVITVNKRLDGTPVTTIDVNPDIYPPVTTETEEVPQTEEPEETEAMTLPDGAEIVTQPAPQPLGQVVPVQLQDNFAIANQYLEALTADDFGGVAVNIMTSDASIFMPESAGNPVDNARIERNEMVEEKYNTRIIAIDTPVSEIYANTRLAVMSGDYYTDLIAVPQNWLGSFAMSGLLLNLRSLPFTNYNRHTSIRTQWRRQPLSSTSGARTAISMKAPIITIACFSTSR